MNIFREWRVTPSVRRWALIKVYLFGIWIMNKHWREMAAINLSLSPSYSKTAAYQEVPTPDSHFPPHYPSRKDYSSIPSTERYVGRLFRCELSRWYAVDVVVFILQFRHRPIIKRNSVVFSCKDTKLTSTQSLKIINLHSLPTLLIAQGVFFFPSFAGALLWFLAGEGEPLCSITTSIL